MRDRRIFVLSNFEAHFSEVTFGTCLASKTGRRGSEWSKGKLCLGILDRMIFVLYSGIQYSKYAQETYIDGREIKAKEVRSEPKTQRTG